MSSKDIKKTKVTKKKPVTKKKLVVKEQEKKVVKDNKGFTLIEIIGVVVILGVLAVIGTMSVRGYIDNSRAKTYESYKKELAGASKDLMIECLDSDEGDCVIPRKGNDVKISYNDLLDKGYSKRLKDPEGNGYCDRSYVIAKNNSDNGVDIEYQVCLFCSNYKSTEDGCVESDNSDRTPPTCGEIIGEGDENNWSGTNRVITVKCSDGDSGCARSEFSASIGEADRLVKRGTVTIEDNAGNRTNCLVNAYVDRQKPTCRLEVEGEYHNGWYSGDVNVKLASVSDGQGSGVLESGMGTSLMKRSYNGKTSYTVSNGIVTVFGYVKDKVGNEGYCSQEIRIDDTKPTGTVYMGYQVYPKEESIINLNVMTINGLDKYGDIEGLVVTLNTRMGASDKQITITDAVGKKIKLSGGINVGSTKGVIKIEKGTYSKLTITIPGISSAKDIAKVEVVKNETTTSIWTNKDVSIYVEAKDTITGVDYYSYDNGSTYTTSNIKAYAENTIGVVVIKDKAGNVSLGIPYTINKIDKEKPTCVLQVDGTLGSNGWYTSNVNISFASASDTGGSGVEFYGIDSYGVYEATLTTDTTTAGKNYAGKIVDRAGNENTCSIKVKRDATVPVIKATWASCADNKCYAIGSILENIETNNSSNVIFSKVIDWNKKGGRIDYKVDDRNFFKVVWEWNAGGSSGYTAPTAGMKEASTTSGYETLTEEGYRVGILRAYDTAGNSTSVLVQVKVDRTAPSLSFTNPKNGVWTNQNISFTVNSADNLSEIEGYYYSYNGVNYTKSTKNMTFSDEVDTATYIRVCDNAGNCATKSTSIRIDKTPPTPYIFSDILSDAKITQTDLDGNVLTEARMINKKCNIGGNTCSADICLVMKKGNMSTSGERPINAFSDSGTVRSGLKSTDRDSMMLSKNNTVIDGCLYTEGHNPCTWVRSYYATDNAGNKSTETFEITYRVGYNGVDSFCK